MGSRSVIPGCPGKQGQPFGGLYSQLYCLKYVSYEMER